MSARRGKPQTKPAGWGTWSKDPGWNWADGVAIGQTASL